jgi:ABC-type dipeptide/oligopeptide/nickel transport system permease subunit
MVALLVVVVYGVVAVLAGLIAPYPAGWDFVQFVSRPQPPSLQSGHLLGTDLLGHDVFSQLLFAVRGSMEWSLVCMQIVALTCGVALVAGGCGGPRPRRWTIAVLRTAS